MKADIHPEYRYVVFRDVSSGFEFLTRSCASAREETEHEGETYPLIPIDISSESHPFYTGTQKLLDTEGRVERFYRKYGFAKTPEASGEIDEPSDGGTAES
jgi:large subunit ribosomal protein L31